MRDTLLLRARLQAALVSGPLAIMGLACGGSPAGQAPQASAGKPLRSSGESGAKVAARPKPVRASVAKAAKEAKEAEDAGRPFAKSAYPDRWGLDPYDPEAAEEEGCVSGDWCGSLDAVLKFKNDTGEPDVMACPTRIAHVANNGAKEGSKVYEGLSFDPMMQGRLRHLSTEEARTQGGEAAADTCCYHWFNYCSGRPLLASGAADGTVGPQDLESLLSEDAQVAPLLAGGDAWSAQLGGEAIVAGTLASQLAAAWLVDAQMEHASVAVFARASLELLALGAPPHLVAGAMQAGLDEVEHARICFAMAERYGASPRTPGPLPAVSPRTLDHVGLAVATFVEGCVGETIAALMATRAARGCAEPTVRAALERIAADESRHAELAWGTVAWAHGEASRSGQGEAFALALRSAAARLCERGEDVEDGELSDDGSAGDRQLLAAHGRLGQHALAQLRDDAWSEIITPMLATLLG